MYLYMNKHIFNKFKKKNTINNVTTKNPINKIDNITTKNPINNKIDNVTTKNPINNKTKSLLFFKKITPQINNTKTSVKNINPSNLNNKSIHINKDQIKINNVKNKECFRVLCNNNLNYIRNIDLPEIKINSKYEAILIEYRCFQHLEFLIRNTIIKLGNEWSHTIVCGNLNYDYMINICKTISNNIKIIKTDYDNLDQNTYSILLSNKTFWESFSGEKILLYQEDSCIFNSNINDFLEWDYIGAPWSIEQNDTLNCVGNGGFSLRSKETMIKVIDHTPILETNINSSTKNYMNFSKLHICPEDVYFSKNIQDFNLGKVADWNTAFKFSTETIYNPNSFAGHNFWLSDNLWQERILSQSIITFKLHSRIKTEHRGGWNTIIDLLFKNNIFNDKSPYLFLDMVERYFLWSKNKEINTTWSGIIHCTPSTPKYLDYLNISLLFKNKSFIDSLDYCYCIFSLSTYITKYLEKEFSKINKNIKIFTIKHPIEMDNIKLFDLNNYIKSSNKKLVQIGQQLRKCTSIYLLNNIKHQRIWLTGSRNIKRCNELLNKELEFLSVKLLNKNTINMYYTSTIEEYDNILSCNIVFVDLFDAAANNVVLECIIRNTPLIIRKVEGVVEYLGKDYPLYFDNLNQVYDLLHLDNIKKSHEYFKNMDKSDITMDYFLKKMINNLMSLKI